MAIEDFNPKPSPSADPKPDEVYKATKEFLFKEYDLFKEFFQGDLGVAEKRVNFFIKITGGAVAFIGTLLGLSDSSIFGVEIGSYQQFLMLGGFICLILFVTGHSILTRISYMNVSHEKWKARMFILRNKFREICPSLRENYTPFEADCENYRLDKDYQKWGDGRLNDFMLKINSIIMVVFFEFFLEMIRYYFEINEVWWILLIVGYMLSGYAVGYLILKYSIDRKTKGWKSATSSYVRSIKSGIITIETNENREQ